MGDAWNHEKVIATMASGHHAKCETGADLHQGTGPMQQDYPYSDPFQSTNRNYSLHVDPEGEPHNTTINSVKPLVEGSVLNQAVEAGGDVSDQFDLPVPKQDFLTRQPHGGDPPYGNAFCGVGSSDLKIESKRVLRHGDTIHLNADNCRGPLNNEGVPPEFGWMPDDVDKLCVITKVWGQQMGEAPRELGPKPGTKGAQGTYIEVLAGAVLEVFCEWKDVSQNPAGVPRCWDGSHPLWLISRKGSVKNESERPADLTIPNATGVRIGEPFTQEPYPGVIATAQALAKKTKEDVEKRIAEAVPAFAKSETADAAAHTKSSSGGSVLPGLDEYLGAEEDEDELTALLSKAPRGEDEPKGLKEFREKVDTTFSQKMTSKENEFLDEEQRKTATKAERFFYDSEKDETEGSDAENRNEALLEAGKEWGKIIDAIYAFWDHATNPPVVLAKVGACGAGAEVTVKVFPKGKLEVDLFAALGKSYWDNTMKLFKGASKAAAFISARGFGEIKFDWLQEPGLVLTTGYKELTKDGTNNWGTEYWKVQCGRYYKLAFTFDPLLRVVASASLSLNTFAGWIGWLLSFVVEARLSLGVMIQVVPVIEVACDEYGDFSGKIAGSKIEAKLYCRGSVDATVASAYVEAGVYGAVSLGSTRAPECKSAMCLFEVPITGFFQVYVLSGAESDFFGRFKWEKKFNWYPEEGRWPAKGEKEMLTYCHKVKQ